MKVLVLITFLIPFLVLTQPSGNGMVFNGATDYYIVNDNSSIDLNGSFTIEAWINPCDTVGSKLIVAKQWCGSGGYSYSLSNENGQIQWFWSNNGGCTFPAINRYLSTIRLIRNNMWQHIAVVHTPTNISIFYNGNLISGGFTQGGVGGVVYNSNVPLQIGVYKAASGNYSRYFNGRMDEIRMWNTALSAAQISSRYNSPLIGNESNLQLYHNFESVSGATINNSSSSTGIVNNGTNINGSPLVISNNTSYPSSFILGNDTVICQPNTVSITIPSSYSNYSWSDGFTSRTKVVSTLGAPIVGGYKDFCFAADTISISIIDCDTTVPDPTSPIAIDTCKEKFIMPNVFTPNGDGVNDVFKPVEYNCFSNINFSIYNRWGQIVYESSKISWNGKNKKGKLVSDGTYYWVLIHADRQGKEEFKKGVVNLF